MKFKIEYSKYINRELLKSTWEQFAEALRYCWKYDFKKVDFKQLDPRKLNFHQFGPRQFGAAVIKRIDQHVFSICIVILAVLLSAALIIKIVDLGITLAFTPYTVKKAVEKSKPTQQEIAAKFSALKKRAA
jgi:hypothetical protein